MTKLLTSLLALASLACGVPVGEPAPLPEIVGEGAVILAGDGALLLYGASGEGVDRWEISAGRAEGSPCPTGSALLLLAGGADPEGELLPGAPLAVAAGPCPVVRAAVGGGLPLRVEVEVLSGEGPVQISAKVLE